MQPAITLKKLSKTFCVKEPSSGFLGLFRSSKQSITAIQNLSLKVNKGERIGFIGPNGAGKSTTIKLLTGILHPSSGDIKVLGLNPSQERNLLGYKIGTIFGQKSKLWYHLPPLDTFHLLSKIYNIPLQTYEKRLKELVDLFEIDPLLTRPVKTLSLGERMRCELVASLLHKPEILFLDEPTIGLDTTAKFTLRALLHKLSHLEGTTLFVTSHDMADIEQVCHRVVILNKGSLLLDSSVKELKQTYKDKKILSFLMEHKELSIALPGVQILDSEPYQLKCKVDLQKTSVEEVIQKLLKQTALKDITLEDLSMDQIVRMLYGNKTHA